LHASFHREQNTKGPGEKKSFNSDKSSGGRQKANFGEKSRLPKAIFLRIFRSYFLTNIKFMADAANKYAENVPGKFYVDNQCIDCDLCRETAPDNFKRNEDGGYSFVYKQPASPDEEARCKEAKEACPVEAIGDNA
jgi:ferredoxin